MKDYSSLAFFTRLVPVLSPEICHSNWPLWGPRKQAEDKIGTNVVRDKRRRKKTYSVTLTEMGKYRQYLRGEKNHRPLLHKGKGLTPSTEAMLYARLLQALKHKPEKLKRKQSLILLFHDLVIKSNPLCCK